MQFQTITVQFPIGFHLQEQQPFLNSYVINWQCRPKGRFQPIFHKRQEERLQRHHSSRRHQRRFQSEVGISFEDLTCTEESEGKSQWYPLHKRHFIIRQPIKMKTSVVLLLAVAFALAGMASESEAVVKVGTYVCDSWRCDRARRNCVFKDCNNPRRWDLSTKIILQLT